MSHSLTLHPRATACSGQSQRRNHTTTGRLRLRRARAESLALLKVNMLAMQRWGSLPRWRQAGLRFLQLTRGEEESPLARRSPAGLGILLVVR